MKPCFQRNFAYCFLHTVQAIIADYQLIIHIQFGAIIGAGEESVNSLGWNLMKPQIS